MNKGKNSLVIKTESGDKALSENAWPEAVLVAVDTDPYNLVRKSVVIAAERSGGGKSLSQKIVPRSLDYFGWCSWDAFYSSVSAPNIFQGIESLQRGHTPPRFVIIDDGWQQTDLDSYPDVSTGFVVDDLNSEIQYFSNRHRHNEAFITAESRALGPAMRNITEGSSSGAALQELIEATGQKGDLQYHNLAVEHEKKKAVFEKVPSTWIAFLHRKLSNVLDSAAGYLMGLLQVVFVSLYEIFVDPAANGSWAFKLFSKLSHGPLRGPLLDFIADQTNFSRRLTNIQANAKFKLSHGSEFSDSPDLKSVIQHLKTALHVDFVICWHGISAYWSGISLESADMMRYAPHNVHPDPQNSLLDVEPSMKWNPTVLMGMGALYDPFHLFNDMHKYLCKCGVSGVKVDCQAGIGLVGSVAGGGASVALRYHDALEASTSKHFEENLVINCMCHTIENIYHWKKTAVARASDDFYPSDRASHLAHIVACAYNGLFLSPLVVPDFDMFQSNHEASEAHAVARAVSGGPVYVSDAPGKHDFSVLKRLVLVNGTVLRTKQPCRPTVDCLFNNVTSDGRSALKLWSLNYSSALLGVFNLQGSSWDRDKRKFHTHASSPCKVQASIRPSDIPMFNSMRDTQEFLITCTSGDRCMWNVVSPGDATEISLTTGQAAAVAIVPIHKFKVQFCPVGLEGMINGAGSTLLMHIFDKEWIMIDFMSLKTGINTTGSAQESINWDEVCEIRLDIRGCGVFLVYCDALPVKCTIDGIEAEWHWSEYLGKLAIRIPEPDGDPKKSSLQHEIFLAF
ncbi:hypothetical protein M9435_004565 [Picochlorum sp. BPE23]|nr:hypothetical protein M9435_004565 [Picochlorum sp. BPE23]